MAAIETSVQTDPGAAWLQVIRIAKADSAWVYHVLEAQEGIVSYSTLPEPEGGILTPAGLPACELELTIPAAFVKEVALVLEQIEKGGLWIKLPPATMTCSR
ncbi:MAG: hypothetical protein ACK5QT_07315 [Oligoflexia bacterium]